MPSMCLSLQGPEAAGEAALKLLPPSATGNSQDVTITIMIGWHFWSVWDFFRESTNIYWGFYSTVQPVLQQTKNMY